MSASSPMRHLGWWFWWANHWFTKPGLYVWMFRRNVRVLPVPRRWA